MRWCALMLFGTLHALPIGNPLTPALYDKGLWDSRAPYFSWGHCTHIRFGYYGDFVFNREVEQINQGDPEGSIQQMTLMTNGGTLTLDIYDYCDLYLLIGATKIGYHTPGAFGDYSYFNFSTTACWSIGGVLDLWECGCFGLGIEGQYFQTKPKLDSLINLRTGQMIYFNDFNRMKWREWQGGIAATYRYYDSARLSLSPYIGVKAAAGTLKQHSFQFTEDGLMHNLNRLETSKLWGFALGLTVVSSAILGGTIEGRWADERAVYCSMQLSY